MKCKICERKAESEFCKFHKISFENLVKKFEEWRKSMDISWLEYLRMLQNNPYTGVWVKEVIQYLLSKNQTGQQESEKHSNV
ncbi:MAG TPA: hypothetical protein ENH03_01395 [Candidatus Bathyarchaeota archaeon]|nr:hypothetical protein [Candidatus Bathyarchaeota archaeon]